MKTALFALPGGIHRAVPLRIRDWPALYDLLQKPGMLGHAHLRTAAVVAEANDDPIETQARNRSLKELILGRGLYLCGDHEGLGRRILETYANDLRGQYARHAQAILACTDLQSLKKEVM